MRRRKDVVHPETMIDMMWFEPTLTEDVPTEFYLPAAATKAVALLQMHGVQMRKLTQPVRGVEQFVITSNGNAPSQPSPADRGSHTLRRLEGAWGPAPTDVPAGAFAVPMKQPLARLAFYLLAPTSDDGLTAWNYFDDMLGAEVKVYPVLRKK
jgi:hypothetical protein